MSTVVASRERSALRRVQRDLGIAPRRLAAAVLAACATLGAAFALAAVSAYLVTRAWTMPPVLDLTVAVVAVRALGISRGVFRWVERMLTHDAALRGVVTLRTRLYAALARRGDDAVTRLRRGDLLARLGDDAQELADHVISAVVPALVAAVMALVVLVTFAPLSLLACAVMLVSLLLASVLAPLFGYRAALLREQASLSTRADLTAQSLSLLDDATALQLSGRIDAELEQLGVAQRRHDLAIDRAAVPAAVAASAVPAATLLAVMGSLLAASSAWTSGELGAGQIGILLLLPLSAFEAAGALPAAAAQLARSRAAAARLDEAMGPEVPRSDGADRTDAVPAAQRPDADRPVGRLLARGLTTGWEHGAALQRDLDLDLAPGARLAVVGGSGTGKSTLLATLAGLLEPLEGAVEVHLPGAAPAPPDPSQVTWFAEDAHVFATSVRENLHVVRGDISDAQMTQALEAVGLRSWLDDLPAGLGTMLGADGTTISGGERRRLLLARAVLHRGPILLLDEPTEHLDPQQGDALLRRLLDPAEETLVPPTSTVVVVTHRVEALPRGTALLRLEADGGVRKETL